MDMICVNPPDLRVCPHCNGSSLCAHSLLVRKDRSDARLVPRCSRCGDGLARHSALLGETRESRPPLCAVCGGKGYVAFGAAIPKTITSKGAP